jgi:uncharacterized HhH-GPD family protein
MTLETKRTIVKRLKELSETLEDPAEDNADYDETDPYENPLKFLLAVIFDQGIGYARAWRAPTQLEQRLGHLDLKKISQMKQKKLAAILSEYPALHRFNYTVAGWIIAASKLLLAKYDGQAARIWHGKPTAVELEGRFREFKGIKQKKGSMAVNILVREYDLPISGGKAGIDVSNDVHVRRVFLRTGLSPKPTEEGIVNAARQLNPGYPGALDIPAWRVGHYWCHKNDPECRRCPLDNICPKKFREVELD